MLQALVEVNGVPGIGAAVWRDDKLVWTGCAGWRDREAILIARNLATRPHFLPTRSHLLQVRTKNSSSMAIRVLTIVTMAGVHPFANAAVDYLRDIKPVLAERCQSCHGALKQKAGLRLDTAQRLLAGGDGDLVVIPGKPDESRLISRLTTTDVHERMPLEAAPLKPTEIAAIRSWIEAGLRLPRRKRPRRTRAITGPSAASSDLPCLLGRSREIRSMLFSR